jgi:spermidine synthase
MILGPGAVVLERRAAVGGGELVLRRAGEHFEVIADGVFLMDTRDGRSERALVASAVEGLESARVLIGGLGVGFSLDEALARPEVAAVTVVELEPLVARWSRTHLRGLTRHGLDDPRATLVLGDVAAWVANREEEWDVICLDCDNGPGWLVREANAWLYKAAGLAAIARRLAPGGRLAVWSARLDLPFGARLRAAVGDVRTLRFGVPRGPDDVVYVATKPAATPE